MESWRAVSLPDLPGRGPEPRLVDTATGEPAVAAQGHTARIYACGITPYDATHIGHAATYTAWDLLVRALRDAGHDVLYVQNVTDVDDPLLERAARDGVDWRALADCGDQAVPAGYGGAAGAASGAPHRRGGGAAVRSRR